MKKGGRVSRKVVMAAIKSQKKEGKKPVKAAVYEVEEEPDKEAFKFKGVDGVEMDSDMNSDFEDEEIDEDEAFNEEDDTKYGDWFEKEDDDQSQSQQEDEESDEEEEDDDEDNIFGDVDEQKILDEEQEENDNEGTLQQEDIDDLLDKVHHVDRSKQQHEQKMERLRNNVVNEAVPEGEFNLSNNQHQGELSVGDLLGALGEEQVKKLGGVRKSLEKLQRKGPSTAPLSKSLRDRETRKAAYEYRSKETGKWVPIVKANREVQTVQFTSGREFLDHTINTTALAEKFTPQTDLEKEVASLLKAARADTAEAVLEAEEELAMKEMSIEELRARHDRLAKMRAQMFREESKAKRLKKIKSKNYRKRLRKQLAKQDEIDPEDEAAMEAARQEFELQRAKERVSLRHKNTGRYLRRKLKVIGFQNLRAEEQMQVAEQNRIAQELKKKAEDMRQKNSSDEDSSSTDSYDDMDQGEEGQKGLGQSNSKLQKAALQILSGQGEEEDAKKGLFALPFMKRAIQKKKLENQELAKTTLQELDPNAKFDDYEKQDQLEKIKNQSQKIAGGKMVFGANSSQNGYIINTEQYQDDEEVDSDSSDDMDHITEKRQQWKDALQTEDKEEQQQKNRSKKVTFQSPLNQESMLTKSQIQITQNSDAHYQKNNFSQSLSQNNGSTSINTNQYYKQQNDEEEEDEKDQVMQWSQEDIIREAFAGDDVEQEFLEEKAEFAGSEIPSKLKQEDVLPGWGSWARSKNTAQKILEAKEKAKAEQEAAAKKRKDANLKRVIISENWDIKAANLMVQKAPYPHTKETFNAQMKMPIGKEYNTRESFKDFTRPEILKRAGVVIQPLEYDKEFQKNEDVVGFKRKSMIVAAGQTRPGKLAKI